MPEAGDLKEHSDVDRMMLVMMMSLRASKRMIMKTTMTIMARMRMIMTTARK